MCNILTDMALNRFISYETNGFFDEMFGSGDHSEPLSHYHRLVSRIRLDDERMEAKQDRRRLLSSSMELLLLFMETRKGRKNFSFRPYSSSQSLKNGKSGTRTQPTNHR